MTVKVFVLGRPGSGKSFAARIIKEIVRNRRWKHKRINDYDILYKMFLADTEHRQFENAEPHGFRILDHAVRDEVLRKVEIQAQSWCAATEKQSIVIMEIASKDYSEALQCFDPLFLQNASFLFVEANVDMCVQRVLKRISYTDADPPLSDNHFVPEDVIRGYFAKDNREYISSSLGMDFGITKKIAIIDNENDFWQPFANEVYSFINAIFQQENPSSTWPPAIPPWLLPVTYVQKEPELEDLD